MLIDENCHHQTEQLSTKQIAELLKQIPAWSYDESTNMLSRIFKFSSYAQGPSFAVAVGNMADQQDHHPDLHIYYKKCVVEFTTHSAGGVSMNDFICAAKTDQIFTDFET